jgi:protein-tyrosine phosphatase
MQHMFWLAPGRLAGRSGPSKDPWDLSAIRTSGVGAILSVNDGEDCHAEDFRRAGLAYRCVPLTRNAPPEEGDAQHCLAALPKAFAFALQVEQAGMATLVHCHSGKDRTGLFLSYYAMRKWGVTPAVAIARVKAVRPSALSAPGWEEFALEVLSMGGA